MAPRGMDTDSHDLSKVKQSAIFLSKMIADRDWASRTKLENNGQKQNFYHQWEQQQSFHHPHSISVVHRYVIRNKPDLTNLLFTIYEAHKCGLVSHKALVAFE